MEQSAAERLAEQVRAGIVYLRPLWNDEEQLPDQELVAAIRDDGWGALFFWDRDTA